MRKTLVLHIGHYKTGTTALQVFCANNAKALRKLGIDYTAEMRHLAKHSRPAFALLKAAGARTLMHGFRDPAPVEAIWAELFEAVHKSKSPQVLISSEEFMRLGAHPEAETLLARIFAAQRNALDVRIIAYLRAPQAHLRSWYNQLVKMNMPVPGFNETVRSVMEPIHYDYALALGPWLRLFGPEAVTIRPYTDALRKGDALFADFIAALGLPPQPLQKWALPEADVNPRMDDRLLELARVMRLLDVPKAQRGRMLERARGFLDLAGDPAADLTEISQRAQAGLEELAHLPGTQFDTKSLTGDLPQPEDPRIGEQAALLGLMLQEHRRLSHASDKKIDLLTKRVEALEAALSGTRT